MVLILDTIKSPGLTFKLSIPDYIPDQFQHVLMCVCAQSLSCAHPMCLQLSVNKGAMCCLGNVCCCCCCFFYVCGWNGWGGQIMGVRISYIFSMLCKDQVMGNKKLNIYTVNTFYALWGYRNRICEFPVLWKFTNFYRR